MSTNVNININTSTLSAQALEQTLASRQSFSIKSDQQKSAVLGRQRLQQSRKDQGLDPVTGQPLIARAVSASGGSLTPRRVDEEPAANRRKRDEIVIYYPDTPPPLTTRQDAEIKFADGVYSPVKLGEVNALGITLNSNYDSYGFSLDLRNSSFLLEDQSFTVEFFARLGTSLSGPANNASFSGLRLFTETVFFDAFLLYLDEGVNVTGGVEQLLQLTGPPDRPYDPDIDEVPLTIGQATTLAHIAIQYHQGLGTTVHYNGAKVYDQGMLLNGLNSIDPGVGALNVPDPLLSQIRLTKGIRYKGESFIPPTGPFINR
jgi:hypothetical protein